jgi:hypothetical protein
MKTSISRLAIIALLCLQAWATQAHGGDRRHGDPAVGESREDLFRLGGRGEAERRRDDLFRLDGGRRDGSNPFSLDGGRRDDRRDGRRDGGPRRIEDGYRHDDGRARTDGHRGDGYRRDGRHDGRTDGGHYRDGLGRGETGGLQRVRDDDRDARRHDGFRDGRFGDDHRRRDHDYRRNRSGPHVRHEVRHIVHHLPPRHAVILHGRDRYHYHGGRYYRPWNAGFILVRPPLGLIVLSLPLGSRTVISAGFTYHVFGDVYYRRVPAGYEVVEPVRSTSRAWPARVSVAPDLLNLRYGPDAREEVIAPAGRHTVLNVIGSAPGWLYVEIDGEDMRGWVMERYVTANLGRG